MANPVSRLFSRLFSSDASSQAAKGLRLDQNDWAAEYMTWAGNAYPLGNGFATDQTTEISSTDFEEFVRGAYKASGVVFGTMQARSRLFVQARFQYQKLRDGQPGDLFGKPELGILEKPWSNAQTQDLLARAIQDADLGGNHYVVTEGVGDKKRLRRLSPQWVDIILTEAPDKAVKSDIAGYLYRPGGTLNKDLWEIYPIDGSNGVVAHWAPIPDPEAQYRGMSWLTPILTEIASDKAMIKHKHQFFRHAATPPITVSFKETVSPEQFKNFVAKMERGHAGVDNAYKTLVLGGGADVKVIGASLAQIDFAKTGGHGEARIMQAGGVHPLILGLSEEQVRTALSQTNLQAAKNLLADLTMKPLWESISNAYSVLVPELSNARLWYDERHIAFLREDRLAVAEVQSTEATMMGQLINNGFTPDSVLLAIINKDWSLLEHTGLVSVQLQVPGQPIGGDGAIPPPAGDAPDANTPDPTGKADTPDKADKGKSSKPPTPSDDQ